LSHLRWIKDLSELRAWAHARQAWPVRRLDGRLALGFREDICRGVRIGWGEFEVNFRVSRCVLVSDEASGSTRAFVGTESEAEDFAAQQALAEVGAAGREAQAARASV
jgi:hypothetical protein